MDAADGTEPTPMTHRSTVERRSDRELVITRLFAAPPRIIFEAWTTPALIMRWWAPKSMGIPLLSCETDARTGGSYRFAFGADPANPMVFFGQYLEVIPPSRLVWTNEESADGPVTTVTFEERGDGTLLTLSELYPSKEALDEAIAGMEEGMAEQFGQLDELLVALGADRGET